MHALLKELIKPVKDSCMTIKSLTLKSLFYILIIMKKPLKLTFVFLLLFSAVQAQTHIKTGPRAGINIATMSFKSTQDGKKLSPIPLAAFHVGWDVEFNLAKNLGLQSGIEITSKGSLYNVGGTSFRLTPSYLEIPVNLMVKNVIAPMLFLSAGPYFAYAIHGDVQYGAIITNMNLGNSTDSMIKRFDCGLDIGIGLDAPALQISGKYEMGITNLSPGGYFNKMRNGVFEISLTVFLKRRGYHPKGKHHHRFLRALKNVIIP